MAEDEIVEPEQELLENGEDTSEEEALASHLTIQQKFILLGIGVFSLIFFLFLMFPYEGLARTLILKSTQESGTQVDFKKLSLSLFGTTEIDSLFIQTKENLEFQSEEVAVLISIIQYLQDTIVGEVKFTKSRLETQDYTINGGSVILQPNLKNFGEDTSTLKGSLGIQVFNGKIQRSPAFQILGDLKDVTIKSIILNLNKAGTTLTIEKGVLNLSIAKIQVRGNIEIANVFKNSRLSLEICPVLSPEFAKEREDIAGLLQLAPKKGNETCIPLGGTFADPKMDMPTPGKTTSP